MTIVGLQFISETVDSALGVSSHPHTLVEKQIGAYSNEQFIT